MRISLKFFGYIQIDDYSDSTEEVTGYPVPGLFPVPVTWLEEIVPYCYRRSINLGPQSNSPVIERAASAKFLGHFPVGLLHSKSSPKIFAHNPGSEFLF